MRPRRVLFGWQFAPGKFCLSHVAPDIPQIPRLIFGNMPDAEVYAVGVKARVIWTGSAERERQAAEWSQSH